MYIVLHGLQAVFIIINYKGGSKIKHKITWLQMSRLL